MPATRGSPSISGGNAIAPVFSQHEGGRVGWLRRSIREQRQIGAATIKADGTSDAAPPQIAIDAAGNAAVSWTVARPRAGRQYASAWANRCTVPVRAEDSAGPIDSLDTSTATRSARHARRRRRRHRRAHRADGYPRASASSRYIAGAGSGPPSTDPDRPHRDPPRDHVAFDADGNAISTWITRWTTFARRAWPAAARRARLGGAVLIKTNNAAPALEARIASTATATQAVLESSGRHRFTLEHPGQSLDRGHRDPARGGADRQRPGRGARAAARHRRRLATRSLVWAQSDGAEDEHLGQRVPVGRHDLERRARSASGGGHDLLRQRHQAAVAARRPDQAQRPAAHPAAAQRQASAAAGRPAGDAQHAARRRGRPRARPRRRCSRRDVGHGWHQQHAVAAQQRSRWARNSARKAVPAATSGRGSCAPRRSAAPRRAQRRLVALDQRAVHQPGLVALHVAVVPVHRIRGCPAAPSPARLVPSTAATRAQARRMPRALRGASRANFGGQQQPRPRRQSGRVLTQQHVGDAREAAGVAGEPAAGVEAGRQVQRVLQAIRLCVGRRPTGRSGWPALARCRRRRCRARSRTSRSYRGGRAGRRAAGDAFGRGAVDGRAEMRVLPFIENASSSVMVLPTKRAPASSSFCTVGRGAPLDADSASTNGWPPLVG